MSEAGGSGGAGGSAPQTILVVDDNEAGRYVTVRVLAAAGYRVKKAASGEAALPLAQDLPGMSGFEVAARLRAEGRTALIPVLTVSAASLSSSDRVQGLEGADAYLTHPIEPPVLLATVRALLRMRGAENDLRRLNARLEREVEERTHRLQEMTLDLHGLALFHLARPAEAAGAYPGLRAPARTPSGRQARRQGTALPTGGPRRQRPYERADRRPDSIHRPAPAPAAR